MQTFDQIRAGYIELDDKAQHGDPSDLQCGVDAFAAARAMLDWAAANLTADQQAAIADAINQAWGIT